ncbi:MAG TPA: PQQ-binding-like beta-propeller repeat protein [Candidatus Methylomirabilis sp.]|nr:PQQ-binding-like beta-propeller repeat protein [Candidatus Methylomirabilis sp.]
MRGRCLGWLAVLLPAVTAAAIVGYASRAATQIPAADPAVLQHHKNPSRDGHYVDPAFTPAAAAQLHLDPGFHATLSGPTFAQPLFWAAVNASDRDLLFVATEQNEVSALDPSTGAVVWSRSLGSPVPLSQMPCGDIDPLGVTGTPVIDPASRTILVGAMTTPDGGITKTHIITALSIDDGSVRPGWPVDVSSVGAGAAKFDAAVQNQRGALALLGGVVYAPYGGHAGDCGDYHGWVVGVPLGDPSALTGWATRAARGGIWAPGGITSDGTSLYVGTGNTAQTTTWGGGEAAIRLAPGPVFSGRPADFFAPTNWRHLDRADRDLGGSGLLFVDVPGATPSSLLVALGKDGNAYLIDPANMGGIGGSVSMHQVAQGAIVNAPAAYTTSQGTYVVFRGAGATCPHRRRSTDLTAIKISATSPPTATVAWCARQNGAGSPMVTTTDGASNAIVWTVGAEGDNRLRGFDGDTGRLIFAGGGLPEAMSFVRRFQTPIAARGRIFVAADSQLYAFTTQ